jgi:ribonuclease HIII
VLPPERLEELKELLLKSGGHELGKKNEYEEFRISLDDKILIAYSTGTIVFHEDLADLISEMFKGLGTRVGIDEVGKGEAEGPLVVCAVAFDDEGRGKAVSTGLVESKMAKNQRIEKIAEKIKDAALAVGTVVISPEEFKRVWKRGNLNELLAKWHAKALESVICSIKRADAVIVDSFDEKRLMKELSPLAKRLGARLVLENGADRRYLEVAAASVIASALREKLMKEGMRLRKWGTS